MRTSNTEWLIALAIAYLGNLKGSVCEQRDGEKDHEKNDL